jgi:hypothetical protein
VDGILADLGVSRYQLTSPERGFSLQAAGPLDMRMDKRQSLTAAAIVNQYPEREIARIIEQMGEERRKLAERIARALVRARPIADTAQLARVVASVAPRTGKIHPATRVFQALRMAVNDAGAGRPLRGDRISFAGRPQGEAAFPRSRPSRRVPHSDPARGQARRGGKTSQSGKPQRRTAGTGANGGAGGQRGCFGRD